MARESLSGIYGDPEISPDTRMVHTTEFAYGQQTNPEKRVPHRQQAHA
jgi:hypothetical protein